MKRSQELELMINALNKYGILETGSMVSALKYGLLSIRRKKYEERLRAKQKQKEAHYRPGRAKSGRETITTEAGLAMLRSGEIPLDGMAKLRGENVTDCLPSDFPETSGEG